MVDDSLFFSCLSNSAIASISSLLPSLYPYLSGSLQKFFPTNFVPSGVLIPDCCKTPASVQSLKNVLVMLV